MESTEKVTRLRIMNMAVELILHNGSSAVTVQSLSDVLNTDRSFLQKYFTSIDNLIDALISDMMTDMRNILSGFAKEELMPFISQGKIRVEETRLIFADADTARQVGQRFMEYLSAVFEYMARRGKAFKVIINESLMYGKRHDCIRQFHNLLLPIPENPVIAGSALDGLAIKDSVKISILEETVYPLMNHVQYTDGDPSTPRAEARREALLKRIARSSRIRLERHLFVIEN